MSVNTASLLPYFESHMHGSKITLQSSQGLRHLHGIIKYSLHRNKMNERQRKTYKLHT